jgi:putative nucleotidyltransferase with HDIG domain
MPKILIVEDDDYFRAAICDLLKSKNYNVLEAPNGKIAKDIISAASDIDIILTDIQMPGLTGIELLEWAKNEHHIPFIVMTGFSTLLETQSAYDLGAKEFIAKPFKGPELIALIEKTLGIEKKEYELLTPQVKEEYCKVSLDEFISKPRMDFDVYIQLGTDKYIKITNKAQAVQKERIEYYRAKGVRFLYIRREDFPKLVEFNLNIATIIKDRGEVSKEKKLKFLRFTGEAIMEKSFIDGLDRTSFNEAQSLLNLTVGMVSESNEHVDLLTMLNTHSDFIYAHSMGAAMYCTMIAKKMGFEANSVFYKLSMAAMFHDIGKKEIDRAILDKPRHLLSGEERKLVESHVTRSQEILMGIKGIPEDIIQIAYEHHEDCAGQGYPNAKIKKDLHPLSRILQISNLFLDIALKGPNNEGASAKDAIGQLERIYLSRVDADCLKALKTLFNLN